MANKNLSPEGTDVKYSQEFVDYFFVTALDALEIIKNHVSEKLILKYQNLTRASNKVDRGQQK